MTPQGVSTGFLDRGSIFDVAFQAEGPSAIGAFEANRIGPRSVSLIDTERQTIRAFASIHFGARGFIQERSGTTCVISKSAFETFCKNVLRSTRGQRSLRRGIKKGSVAIAR